VVVYRDISIAQVEALYPVLPEKEQDYRYVLREDALTYLDQSIAENLEPSVTQQLKITRDKIVQTLMSD